MHTNLIVTLISLIMPLVLQGDISEPFLFIICLYYALLTSINLMKENGFHQEKDEKQIISHRYDYR